MRKTKIVCTIGPATDDVEVIRHLIAQGMNVARINFSHQNQKDHRRRIEAVRKMAKELNVYEAILADTRGPEIRTGMLKSASVTLEQGQNFILTTLPVEGDAHRVFVSYTGLPGDVSPGDTILLDDGNITLEVVSTSVAEVCTIVKDGGQLSNQKGVNLPGVCVNLPVISEQDKSDILFALEMDVEFIATSFIRRAEDIIEIRRFVEEHHGDIKIIAKIETRESVENFASILEVSDGIMVARGDLGVEIPVAEVPLVQKCIIDLCNRAGKPVITATQMLESMIYNPRPTRAEASDVANAIFDGTDAVMLSGETAVGKYPLETLAMMSQICERTEQGYHYKQRLLDYKSLIEKTVTDSISYATCHTAEELGAASIIISTHSGSTARMVSKYRPKAPIVAVTPIKKTANHLVLTWGVTPVISPPIDTLDEMFEITIQAALKSGLVKMGDLVVITGGAPTGISGTTNLLRVESIGDIIAKGTGLGNVSVTGKTCIIDEPEKIACFPDGCILVAVSPDHTYLPAMEKAAGIVVEEAGLSSFAAIVSINLGIPAVTGVENVTYLIPDGETITLDPLHGLVYWGRVTVV